MESKITIHMVLDYYDYGTARISPVVEAFTNGDKALDRILSIQEAASDYTWGPLQPLEDDLFQVRGTRIIDCKLRSVRIIELWNQEITIPIVDDT